MKAFLWRVIYAAVCVVIFWIVFPLFLDVIGFNLAGNLLALLKVCIGLGAIIYVLFGKEPPYPW
jgi:hypothetical protein